VKSPVLGADAVIPRPIRLAGLRLARLRLAARGRLEVRGSVVVERGARVSVASGARVVLEAGCLLGEGSRIEATGGTVRIGPGARIGSRAILVAASGIDVGADCVVGEWAMIADAGPTYADPERPTRKQPLHAEPVRIGDGARVGAHAKLLAGTVLAPGAVVASYDTRAPRSTS
jgi:acetyltransferase-like isoleucine patch superfamily enzyme